MAKIRVMLADDHAVLRSGLKLLINSQPDMEVIGEAGTFSEALERTRDLEPDVLSLDLTMPDGNGMHMIERLSKGCPRTRVLVVTMHDDAAYLRAALVAFAPARPLDTSSAVVSLGEESPIRVSVRCTPLTPLMTWPRKCSSWRVFGSRTLSK